MRRTFLSLCMAGLLAVFTNAPAAAATLRIEFTDLDMKFDGTDLTDSGEVYDFADALATVDFFLDDVRVGSLSSGIFADLNIFNVDPIPAGGGDVGADYGAFTLYTSAQFDQGVALFLDDINLSFIKSPQSSRINLAGVATGEVFEQILPFNLEFDPSVPLDVLFILNLSNVQTYQDYIKSFDAVGTGSVQGEGNVVPEPASMILLGTGLLGAIGMRRRAQAKA